MFYNVNRKVYTYKRFVKMYFIITAIGIVNRRLSDTGSPDSTIVHDFQ